MPRKNWNLQQTAGKNSKCLQMAVKIQIDKQLKMQTNGGKNLNW